MNNILITSLFIAIGAMLVGCAEVKRLSIDEIDEEIRKELIRVSNNEENKLSGLNEDGVDYEINNALQACRIYGSRPEVITYINDRIEKQYDEIVILESYNGKIEYYIVIVFWDEVQTILIRDSRKNFEVKGNKKRIKRQAWEELRDEIGCAMEELVSIGCGEVLANDAGVDILIKCSGKETVVKMAYAAHGYSEPYFNKNPNYERVKRYIYGIYDFVESSVQ